MYYLPGVLIIITTLHKTNNNNDNDNRLSALRLLLKGFCVFWAIEPFKVLHLAKCSYITMDYDITMM